MDADGMTGGEMARDSAVSLSLRMEAPRISRCARACPSGKRRTLAVRRPEHPENSLLCADSERVWQSRRGGWKTYHQPFAIRFKPLYEIGHEPYTIYFPVRR